MAIRLRSLLARIEGQLDRLVRQPSAADAARYWQRIDWACRAMKPLLTALDDADRYQRLLARLAELRKTPAGSLDFVHLSTLLRADCVIWQLSLCKSVPGKASIPAAAE